MTFDKACEYIRDAGRLGSRPGLTRIQKLCGLLGDPQDDLRFIHVAGTNGKGSTACMIAYALAEAGLRAGMYYSPAMTGINDHYMINGRPIEEDDYAKSVSVVAAANEQMIKETGESATQFELETAVAFVYFRDNNCDTVILECGMGGRDDATNTVGNKLCCVITSVSFDHMQYLGNTLYDIADVKAGIITSDCPVIAYDAGNEVIEAVAKRCDVTGSRLYTVKKDSVRSDAGPFPNGEVVDYEEFKGVRISLNGTYQAENAAVALRTLSVLSKSIPRITEDAIRGGLGKVRWPFRFECINTDPLIIVDGAHNVDAALKLRDTVSECLFGYTLILVIGMFADKEYEKVVGILAEKAHTILTVAPPENERALPAEDLAACARGYCEDVRVCVSVEEAYDIAGQTAYEYKKSGQLPAVIACGSLSYLSRFSRSVRTG